METKTKHALKKGASRLKKLPEVNFSHIKNLTDDTGIIQHAIFNIPNRKEGYCLDDNARALLLFVLACKQSHNIETQLQLLHIYVSFMSYTKDVEEKRGSEDSFGRTIMALGFLMNEGPSNMFSKTAAVIFSKAYR